MKKVKEMVTCMSTGKVCFRVRSAYNQLIEVTSSINALEACEQSGTMAYDVAHTAMTAVKNADKAERDAVRAQNHAYDVVWYNLRDKISTEQGYTALFNSCQDVCAVDLDFIAAKQALIEVYKVQHEANKVFKVKQELFNNMYPEV